MELINDLESLKNFLKENLKNPVFGVGVYAFNRLGLEDIIANYHLLCLRYSLDTQLIEKDIELLSLEKGMGTKHITEPRNSTTIISHPRTYEYLQKITSQYKQTPVLIAYKASGKMEKVCQENLWTLAIAPTKFGKALFENKIKFRKILEFLKAPVPPGEIAKIDNLDYGQLSRTYNLPFVIQHPKRGGGKGTFFVKNQDDFDNAVEKLKYKYNEEGELVRDESADEVIVAKLIKGPSPSITGCVTKRGILSTSPQHQLLDMPELYNPEKGSGLFCGHDWSSSDFSDKICNQIYDVVEKVGQFFKSQGYKGIFGLDFLLDEANEQIYVVEANPRMLGSFPTLAMAQALNNEPSILAFHLLEYLDLNYQIDLDKINNLMRQKKQGAHMFLHNLSGSWARNHNVVATGVYRLENEELKFLRPGYKLQHLKEQDEFLITEGVPIKKAHFSPNRRLCRVLTLGSVLESYNKLNPWASQVTKAVNKAFKLRPVFFAGVRKLFNPDFLAKG